MIPEVVLGGDLDVPVGSTSCGSKGISSVGMWSWIIAPSFGSGVMVDSETMSVRWRVGHRIK